MCCVHHRLFLAISWLLAGYPLSLIQVETSTSHRLFRQGGGDRNNKEQKTTTVAVYSICMFACILTVRTHGFVVPMSTTLPLEEWGGRGPFWVRRSIHVHIILTAAVLA